MSNDQRRLSITGPHTSRSTTSVLCSRVTDIPVNGSRSRGRRSLPTARMLLFPDLAYTNKQVILVSTITLGWSACYYCYFRFVDTAISSCSTSKFQNDLIIWSYHCLAKSIHSGWYPCPKLTSRRTLPQMIHCFLSSTTVVPHMSSLTHISFPLQCTGIIANYFLILKDGAFLPPSPVFFVCRSLGLFLFYSQRSNLTLRW